MWSFGLVVGWEFPRCEWSYRCTAAAVRSGAWSESAHDFLAVLICMWMTALAVAVRFCTVVLVQEGDILHISRLESGADTEQPGPSAPSSGSHWTLRGVG